MVPYEEKHEMLSPSLLSARLAIIKGRLMDYKKKNKQTSR